MTANGSLSTLSHPAAQADGGVSSRLSDIHDTPLRLNIGGGGVDIPGHVLVDLVDGKDARTLEYPDNSVDEIYASHILEHIGQAETVPTLKEWHRVLKPGGRLRVAVPDLGLWCRRYVEGECNISLGHLFGGQINERDFHKTGFDEHGLKHCLHLAGFLCCRKFKAEYQDCAALDISLNIECNKPTPSIVGGKFTKRIAAAMTVPRLGFTDFYCQILDIFKDFRISLNSVTGAYYNQGMERAIEDAIEHGPDWVLAMDYDTIIDAQILARLILIADTYPEVDCLVPCQVRRGNDYCMFNVNKDEPDLKYLNYHEIFPITSGHFGCTLLRASGFEKMAKPWFNCKPGVNGWREGHVDGDVGFWKKWLEAGNKIHLAPHVSVGHLETMVTWPRDNFTALHQHTDDWKTHGKPPEAR